MKYAKYIFTIITMTLIGILYEKYKDTELSDEDARNYELVKKYLLNDSSLAQSKRPLLWVHMTYDVNARWWPTFSSRNTNCLNQPYKFLTLKSIIDKCGNDFNICLIDDDTFSKILPGWTVNLNMVAEPIRGKIRQLALARVLHAFGGMLVPSSFICFQNLIDVYETNTSSNCMFVGELIDRGSTSQQVDFFPSTKLMGCTRGCPMMSEYIQYLENMNSTDHTAESNFLGDYGRWCFDKILKGDLNVVTADKLGVKDTRGNPVTIEALMGDGYIDLPNSALGLYVPDDEILKRTKFQWFARLSAKQALESETQIGKYLLISR